MFKPIVLTAVVSAIGVIPAVSIADEGEYQVARTDESTMLLAQTTNESAPRDSFEQLDKDGDGELDEGELSNFGAPAAGPQVGDEPESDRGQRVLNMLDHDGDGAVTPDEFENPQDGERQWQCTDCPAGVEKREKVRDQMNDS